MASGPHTKTEVSKFILYNLHGLTHSNLYNSMRLIQFHYPYTFLSLYFYPAAAKSLQSCPTPCDPIDSSPPGSTIPGILQARILEWVAISFSNAWKWKVKMKLLSRPWEFPGKSTGVGCHCLPITLKKKKKSVSTKWLGSLPKITQLVKQAAVLKPRIKSRALTQLYVYRNVHS